MIDSKVWKEYKYIDIFDIKKGFYNKKPEHTIDGNIPFIGATDSNNGVTEYYSIEDIEAASKTGDGDNAPIEQKLFPPNALCVTNNGSVGYAYYQDTVFTCSHDVNPLYLKKGSFNKFTALFVATVIEHDRYRWAYGRKWRPIRMIRSVLSLPSDDDGEPDWEYMENYIRSLKNEKQTLNHNKPILSMEGWTPFKLSSLFDEIYRSKSNVKAELITSTHLKKEYIGFVSRTENNNGCDCYVQNNEDFSIEKGNAIIIGDTTSTMYYQPFDFVTGDHIVVCRAKWLNRYTALFILTILNKERYRYNYGRAFRMDLIKDTVIMLPTKNDKPDWNYMEQFIKNMPNGDIIN